MIPEEQVPEGERFPQLFRGEGVRGHQYHVFDEPRYVFTHRHCFGEVANSCVGITSRYYQ